MQKLDIYKPYIKGFETDNEVRYTNTNYASKQEQMLDINIEPAQQFLREISTIMVLRQDF